MAYNDQRSQVRQHAFYGLSLRPSAVACAVYVSRNADGDGAGYSMLDVREWADSLTDAQINRLLVLEQQFDTLINKLAS